MDKSPEAFRTISEVAEEMDLRSTCCGSGRRVFPQIKPLKRGGGRRYYRPDDVELLGAVKQLLYGEGYHDQGRAEAVARAGRRDGGARGWRARSHRDRDE